MKVRMLCIVVIMLAFGASYASTQTNDDVPDFSGEWVGIIEWFYNFPTAETVLTSGDPGTVQIYRLNIVQSGDQLQATHLTDGEDVLFTQHPDFYDQPQELGFAGSLQDATLEFNLLPIFMSRCYISMTLHYAVVGDEEVLAGTWLRDNPPIPTPQFTPDPNSNAPDGPAVGCGTPSGGAVVVRRFRALDE